MPNPQQLAVLQQGVEVWNRWRAGVRRQAAGTDALGRPESSGAIQRARALARIDLRRAELFGASLAGADLRAADLGGAMLQNADLRGACLTGADLTGTDLRGADCRGADLSLAHLAYADLRFADLSGAELAGTDLYGARLGWTIFCDIDLSEARWLAFTLCLGSQVDAATVRRSRGQIPEAFLRACAVPEDLFALARSLREDSAPLGR